MDIRRGFHVLSYMVRNNCCLTLIRNLNMLNLPDSAQLFSDSARGIYIPQHFAESVNRDMLTGVSIVDMGILEFGPDAQWYWDAWDNVLDNAILTDSNGVKWCLYQDGDLWIVPIDATWPED